MSRWTGYLLQALAALGNAAYLTADMHQVSPRQPSAVDPKVDTATQATLRPSVERRRGTAPSGDDEQP